MKITFMGAGSTVFARNVLGDCMCTPALQNCEIALYDIDEKRLEDSRIILSAINKNVNEERAVIKTYLGVENRKDALRDATFVVNAIQVGGYEPCTVTDFEIPKKYGLQQTIADTLGIGGIMRGLRTIPVLEGFARDMEEVCPNTLFLNYSNPMAILTGYMQRYTKIKTVGLCHSVQGTSSMLARWIGADMKDVTYKCAGINHQAFFLEYKVNGEDAYPRIYEAIKNPEIYKSEAVRIEMMKGLGYFVTESSGHNSEYNAWFRKRQDLIDKYIPDSYGTSIRTITDRTSHRSKDLDDLLKQDKLDLRRGQEYAASILNAIMGDGELFEFNGNVKNTGLITNLPKDVIVEVPVLASKEGLRPMYIGDLPRQCAALNTVNAQCEELAVEGCLAGDKEMIYHAIINDPLTAAVCSLDEIRQMMNEMFEQNKDKLPMFK